eukprot:1191047-Prymnesium_polylepis.1
MYRPIREGGDGADDGEWRSVLVRPSHTCPGPESTPALGPSPRLPWARDHACPGPETTPALPASA